MSRRGLLGLALGSSGLIALLSAGQTIGGPMRRIALLSTRGGPNGGGPKGSGPADFAVNKTAAMRGIQQDRTGTSWRLELRGTRTVKMSRADLLAMPQHTHQLPIACVEGWSTVQTWTGVRLAELAGMAGVPNPETVLVDSLQHTGSFASAALRGNQVLDQRSLLALSVNGAELSLDHGYPARVMVPNNPGVHQTKWVSKMTFRG
jgi:DMSO/TMAO reductase YedYZ molybdopterin-dependent catalytic subunit